jgi:UDP-N-acetylglucosamine 2-epimerase
LNAAFPVQKTGTNPDKILEAAKISCAHKKSWINPFGDGTTGKKIVNILESGLAK